MGEFVDSMAASPAACLILLSVFGTGAWASMPNMDGVSEFFVTGGQNSFLYDDGKYNFSVGSQIGSSEFGYVQENVWQNGDDRFLDSDTGARETFIWHDGAGEKIAQFRRVAPPRSWVGRLFTSGDGFKDFTGMIITEFNPTSRREEMLYFVGYSRVWYTGFSMLPGHYRVLRFADLGKSEVLVAASKESGQYDEPGGGEYYKMEVMQDKLTMTPDCSDQDPGYCFQVASNAFCKQEELPDFGYTPGCAAGSTVAECCSLSCSSESRDANGPQLLPCVESQVLNDEPVSTIELAVADENDAPMDAWRIYRGCDNNGPGCDPRVLIALATMKTAGERFCFGFDCEYESHGFEHRIGVWLFGSGGWLMLATCFCACIFLCCQKEDRTPTVNHFEQVEDGVRLRDYEQADNTEH